MPVKQGDKVKVEYEGTFDDGTVFDSSKNHGPLEFEAGTGKVIPGFDQAIIGMEVGQEKTIKIAPKDGYGERNEQLIKNLPKDNMPANIEPGVGVALSLPDGRQIPATVVQITDTEVTVDLNHPLAGKVLNFKLKVVSIA